MDNEYGMLTDDVEVGQPLIETGIDASKRIAVFSKTTPPNYKISALALESGKVGETIQIARTRDITGYTAPNGLFYVGDDE